jgi:2-dehydro-3-deoxygalactonokinase
MSQSPHEPPVEARDVERGSADDRDTRLLALDWGTTTLRAHRLGARGRVLETRQLARGIMQFARDAAQDLPQRFERAFEEACGDWLRQTPAAPVIACGMVGSAQGWREAPYLDVPASIDRLASGLMPVQTAAGARLHIVPGLIERGRLPNVLRGEETQIAGALESLAPAPSTHDDVLVGLPGTHSKWALVRGGEIVHFDTFMTGEVYEALCEHTLLGRTLRRGEGWDEKAFDRGLRVARSPEGRAGLLSTIFSTRTLGLTRALSPEAQPDYLSGLLIGHELEGLQQLDRHAFDAARVVLVGNEGLCQRYGRALASVGCRRGVVARGATERGLWRLACSAGLVDAASGASTAAVEMPARDAPELPLRKALADCGLVAILRGVRPEQASEIGLELYAAGWRAIEVPLNSPEPLASIDNLRRALPPDCVIGAGTVLAPAQIARIREAGGQFVVMPHSDLEVVRAARASGLEVAAGSATITEALAALAAGAHVIKMFPADSLGPATLAAWRAVLPVGTRVLPVGGITPANLDAFVAVGAAAFGIGSALYRPGFGASAVAEPAAAFVAAWRQAVAKRQDRCIR